MQDPADQQEPGRSIRQQVREENRSRYNNYLTQIRRLIQEENLAALLKPDFDGMNALTFLLVGEPEGSSAFPSRDELSMISLIKKKGLSGELTSVWRHALFGSPIDNSLSVLKAAEFYKEMNLLGNMLTHIVEDPNDLTDFEVSESIKAFELYWRRINRSFENLADWVQADTLRRYRVFVAEFFNKILSADGAIHSPRMAKLAHEAGCMDIYRLSFTCAYLLKLKTSVAIPAVDDACQKLQECVKRVSCGGLKEIAYVDSWIKIIFCELAVSLLKQKSPLLGKLWSLQRRLGVFVGEQHIFTAQILFADKCNLEDNARLVRDLAISWPESFVEVLRSDALCQAMAFLLETDQEECVLKALTAFPVVDAGLDRSEVLSRICQYISTSPATIAKVIESILPTKANYIAVFKKIPGHKKFFNLKIGLLEKTDFDRKLIDFLLTLKKLATPEQYQRGMKLYLDSQKFYINFDQVDSRYEVVLRDFLKLLPPGPSRVKYKIADYLIDNAISHMDSYIRHRWESFKEHTHYIVTQNLDSRNKLVEKFLRECVFIECQFESHLVIESYRNVLFNLFSDPVFGIEKEVSAARSIYAADELSERGRTALIVDIVRQLPDCMGLVLLSEPLCEALNYIRDEDQSDVFEAIKGMLSNATKKTRHSSYHFLRSIFSSLKTPPSEFFLKIANEFLFNCALEEVRNPADINVSRHVAVMLGRMRKIESGFGWNEFYIFLLSKISEEHASLMMNGVSVSGEIFRIVENVFLSDNLKGKADQIRRVIDTLSVEFQSQWESSYRSFSEKWLNCATLDHRICVSLLRGLRDWKVTLSKRRDSRSFVLLAAAKTLCDAFSSKDLRDLSEVKSTIMAEVIVMLGDMGFVADSNAIQQKMDSLKNYLLARSADRDSWEEATSGVFSHRCRDILELLIEACGLSKQIPISISGQLMLVKYKPGSVETEFKEIAEEDVVDAAVARMRSGMEDYNADIMHFLQSEHPDKVEEVRAAMADGNKPQPARLSDTSVLTRRDQSGAGGGGAKPSSPASR